MAKHICKNPSCQKVFEYCRACIFKPIYYHEAGFCSEECCIEYRTNKSTVEANTIAVEHITANESIISVEQKEVVEIEAQKPVFVIEDVVSVEEVTPKKYKKNKKYKNEIPTEEDTSSFGTEECISDGDIETAQTE